MFVCLICFKRNHVYFIMDKLNSFQQSVLQECLLKKNGGMSLPMGSGKTLLSIVLGLTQSPDDPILVVVAKTLVENWKFEIAKFFGTTLPYQVLHSDYEKDMDAWKLDPSTRLVITTSDVISKVYKCKNIETKFVILDIVNQGRFNQHSIVRYRVPNTPFAAADGQGLLFSRVWGSLIIDEIQKFTKVSSMRCRGLAAICAKHRWGLSGTMFDEPSVERLLGYHLIINSPTFPRTLPAAELHVRNSAFRGVAHTVVKRLINEAFTPPRLIEKIINHQLCDEEQKIYLSMKITIKAVSAIVKKLQLVEDVQGVRRFSSYLLAMITYLRQSIICPLIPIANVTLDMMELTDSTTKGKSDLSKMLTTELDNIDIGDWLDKPSSVVSSRMKSGLSIINKHSDERLVIFTCFRSCLDIFMNQISNRPAMTLCSSMSTKKRAEILDTFSKTSNGILFLTYDLGAEGLNLQTAHTVLLMDMWWNAGKTQQSIARVLRQGQTSATVNVYYFTSNLGIERAMFHKHKDKLDIGQEISDGPLESTVRNIKVQDIIAILENEDNERSLNEILKRM